jgi:HEAT repeat protein
MTSQRDWGVQLSDSSGHEHHGLIRSATWVTDTAIRHRASAGLAKFRRQTVDVLVQALTHRNPLVRLEAAAALGAIGKRAKPETCE